MNTCIKFFAHPLDCTIVDGKIAQIITKSENLHSVKRETIYKAL